LTTKPQQAQKDILGYTLQERIGSGGFGEVWSAIAPGGLLKAVKIVYGFQDEKRAQAELKALDRVKDLRHPFLLSLERIEIFEGQLVVVTELADNSLADVFNEFAIKGEVGIPRDDLIKYMRSVADALDYMSDEHKLQHLDIKPENLLMVSGHVKVADFGLIKDLENASQSLMSGMTPAYAAPELFEQAARRVRPDFLLEKEKGDVARICRSVGGMPLAIELAAGWVRVMSCKEIAAEIEQNGDFLHTTLRNLPDSHRSIRALVEHSWTFVLDIRRRCSTEISRRCGFLTNGRRILVL
jgi:serine/threonine protein kinase